MKTSKYQKELQTPVNMYRHFTCYNYYVLTTVGQNEITEPKYNLLLSAPSQLLPSDAKELTGHHRGSNQQKMGRNATLLCHTLSSTIKRLFSRVPCYVAITTLP